MYSLIISSYSDVSCTVQDVSNNVNSAYPADSCNFLSGLSDGPLNTDSYYKAFVVDSRNYPTNNSAIILK